MRGFFRLLNPATNNPSPPSTASEIFAALDQPHSAPPSAILASAADRWHHVRNLLLSRVDQEIEEVRQHRRSEYSDTTVFTLYLAAEKKDAEVFPTILRLLSVRDFRTIERFGDVFTDDMPVILADCYPGEQALPAMEAVVGDGDVPAACRRAVLNALEILAWQQRVPVPVLRAFLERLADGGLEAEQPRLWAAYAEVCLAAGLHDFEPVVLEASARGWIDARSIPPHVLTAAFAQVREGTYQPFTGPVTIESAAAEVETWDWERIDRNQNRAARPGRNDPCPCGSGKKFKRCCAGGSGS